MFTVERHIRGKWACAQCETIHQVPVDPHIIDKGIPTTGLLAQVLVAKYADHLPLYRQEAIFGRAGLRRAPASQGQCALRLGQLTLELTSLDYERHFATLPRARRDEINASHRSLYKGISEYTIEDVYHALYERQVGPLDPARLWPGTSVTDARLVAGPGAPRVEVTLRGPVDPKFGWVVDFAELTAAWQPLQAQLDHRLLNEVPGLENPTSELLAAWVFERVSIPGTQVSKVRVAETCTSACTVYAAGP